MKKISLKIFHSYEEANEDSLNESLAMKPEQRIAAVNEIRRSVFGFKGIKADNRVKKKIFTYEKRAQ
jgi:hypothetical protein